MISAVQGHTLVRRWRDFQLIDLKMCQVLFIGLRTLKGNVNHCMIFNLAHKVVELNFAKHSTISCLKEASARSFDLLEITANLPQIIPY